jgi:hypothetical protein
VPEDLRQNLAFFVPYKMIPIALICTVLTILGIISIIRDIYEIRFCVEGQGIVTGFKEVYDTEWPHSVTAYIPIITYFANGVEYTGRSRREKLWGKPDLNKQVAIVYNPKDPGYFSLKPASRKRGIIFLVIGVTGLICAWKSIENIEDYF